MGVVEERDQRQGSVESKVTGGVEDGGGARRPSERMVDMRARMSAELMTLVSLGCVGREYVCGVIEKVGGAMSKLGEPYRLS